MVSFELKTNFDVITFILTGKLLVSNMVTSDFLVELVVCQQACFVKAHFVSFMSQPPLLSPYPSLHLVSFVLNLLIFVGLMINYRV